MDKPLVLRVEFIRSVAITTMLHLSSLPTVLVLIFLLTWPYNGGSGESIQNVSSRFDCEVVNAQISSSIYIKCGNFSSVQSQWLFNGNQLYAGTIPLTYKRNIHVDANPYTLTIDIINLSDEGTYSCKKSKHLICTYCVNVFALPEIFIFVNGTNISKRFDGLVDTYYNVTCSAIDGRPAAAIVLKLNNVAMDARSYLEENAENPLMWDSHSTFLYKGEGGKDNLTCLYEDDDIFEFRSSVWITMETFAFPQLYIFCDDNITEDVLTVSKGMRLHFQCVVYNPVNSSRIKLTAMGGNRSNSDTNRTLMEGKEYHKLDNQTTKVSMWLILEEILVLTCQILGEQKFQNQSRSLLIKVNDILNLTLSANGQKYSNGGSLSSSQSYTFVCLSSFERGQFGFTMTITNEVYNGTNSPSNVSALLVQRQNIKMTYSRNVVMSRVTCLARSNDLLQKKTFLFDISATPVLRIQLENLNISQVVNSSRGEVLIFKCVAFSTRVKAHIYFQIDNLTISKEKNGTAKPNKFHPGTLDTEACIEYRVNNNATVTCCSNCKEPRLCRCVDVDVLVQGQVILPNPGVRSPLIVVVVALSTFMLAVVLVFLRRVGSKNCRRTRSMTSLAMVQSTSKTSTRVGHSQDGEEMASYSADSILLLQEYTSTDELSCRIAGLDVSDTYSNAAGLLLNFASQVILGMEFLVSQGLSHPGLSTKKVRVTEANVCQLLDFCLREEALLVMAEMRQEPTFIPCLHPPEATMMDDFNHGTDMWYTGKTVVEIFSQGTIFYIEDEALVFQCEEKNDYNMGKPTLFPTFLSDVLVNCWRRDSSLRPTFADVRSAMEENRALYLPGSKVSVRENIFHEISEEDLYIPMEQ